MAKVKKMAKPRTGVCQYGYEMIRNGKTNEQIFQAIGKKFPKSKLDLAGIGWMRNKLRKDGEKIKTNRELKAKAA